jgi:hypothetical protein
MLLKLQLGQSSVGGEPPLTQAADGGDPLVVAVVVNELHARFFGRGAQQQIGGWDTAMVATSCQRELSLACATPEARRHGDRLERGETSGYLLGTTLVWGKTCQLEDDQVADQDQPGLDGGVEPLGELGKAPVARPGPGAGVKEGRPVELRKLQLAPGAQERSRPAATS